MYKVPLSKIKIEPKLAIMREAISELQKIGRECTQEQFVDDREKFAAAEHYLRRALEAVFDIAGHIVSRMPYAPGNRPKTVKEIAAALGDIGVVDKKFAEEKLKEMAGYRNRLVHFYDEITPKELYQIIARDLGDLESVAAAVIEIVRNPDKIGLTVEE